MKRLEKLVTVDDAIQKLSEALKETTKLDTEIVDLIRACGRVAAEDIVAEFERPPKDISAVDGYAIRAVDVVGASQYNPAELTILGEIIRPGQDASSIYLKPGYAVRVQTGAEIPAGADAVVMDEEVEVVGNKLYVYRQVAEGYNIIKRGEDYGKGEVLLRKGEIISPHAITAIASTGIPSLRVYRRIKVSVISIGDELVEPGSRLEVNKTYNTTSYLVVSYLQRLGLFDVRYLGIVPDDISSLRKVIDRETEKDADIIITTGGTGISESDIVSELHQYADKVIFRGVKIRPGRPTSSMVYNGKVVLNLSGFPVAAWSGLEIILRNAIMHWIGIVGWERRAIYAILSRRVPNVVGYDSIIRVKVREYNGSFYADPYMLRGSGVISSLLRTDGYIVIPRDIEGYEKGTVVKVFLYE